MKLVKTSDYGIKGINYYWAKRGQFGLSKKEVETLGLTENHALVDERVIPLLKKAQETFKEHGYEIIVKDAYRSPELYQFVKKKRYEIDGKENTDRTFNAKRMVHATGLAVDVNLLSLDNGREVLMWDKKDWPDGAFIDFYRDKTDPHSIEFQRLQDFLIETMLGLGFKLGLKKEFWHFEYEPS